VRASPTDSAARRDRWCSQRCRSMCWLNSPGQRRRADRPARSGW
jgi:hypothetical protein